MMRRWAPGVTSLKSIYAPECVKSILRGRRRKISNSFSQNCPLLTTEKIVITIKKAPLHAKDRDRMEIPCILTKQKI